MKKTLNIYNKLKKYDKENNYPFHMPGHKRNLFIDGIDLPYYIDITEINGFDNLHSPEGIILESQKDAASLFKSKESFYLVNGSTCGILAGIRAATKKGDKVIIARNSHKSVYHAIELCELKPIYIMPEFDNDFAVFGSINPQSIEEIIKRNKEVALVIITSPTYEGVLSDVKSIVNIAHQYNIPVLIDEAHGSHLGFGDMFHSSSVEFGADIVIQSLHKTLPSLTQTAIAHFNSNIINTIEFQRQLEIFETSSPSYIFISAIDLCIQLLIKEGKQLFDAYENNLNYFNDLIINLKNLKILGYGNDNIKLHKNIHLFDQSKIVISTRNTNFSGKDLERTLREKYKIEVEMTSLDYIICMTSILDTKDGFKRLALALIDIDKTLLQSDKITPSINLNLLPRASMTIAEALEISGEDIEFSLSNNRISREYVYYYPPGIPILVPGEEISQVIIDLVDDANKFKLTPKSTKYKMPYEIEVIKNFDK